MVELSTVITMAAKGQEVVDSEVQVRNLPELYAVCRDAPPHRVMRVSIRGPEGEVLLNFASFIKAGEPG